MIVYLGSNELKKVYLGNTEIKKIYVGDNLVYGSNVPAAYQEVEYIGSTRTGSDYSSGQYIRTGFKANQNTSIEMEVMPTSLSYNACFWCCRTSNEGSMYCLFRISNELRQDFYYTQAATGYYISANTKYTLKQEKNKLYVNGNLVRTASNGTFQSAYGMLLLASNNRGDYNNLDNHFTGRLYHCKIRDNGTLIHDFYPVYRKSDNVIGLYDIVNDLFYTNQGSGSFTKGPNV